MTEAKKMVKSRIKWILTESNPSKLHHYMEELKCVAVGDCILPSEDYSYEDSRYVITFDDLQQLQSAKHWQVIREQYIHLFHYLYADLQNAPANPIHPYRRVYTVSLGKRGKKTAKLRRTSVP